MKLTTKRRPQEKSKDATGELDEGGEKEEIKAKINNMDENAREKKNKRHVQKGSIIELLKKRRGGGAYKRGRNRSGREGGKKRRDQPPPPRLASGND